jgi:predicted amidophosphoribosyltransferase
MPDPTTAERSRRYRERKAGRLPPAPNPVCSGCGITHRGARGLLCSRCWERLDPAGRAFKAERVRKAKAKAKRKRDGL